MSDAITHIDVDSDDFADAPKALRDHVKKLQKALTEKDTELTTVRTQITSRAISDVLADKGFKNSSRVQKDMLADQIDPSDQKAVDDWLAANSDDYARSEVQDPESAPPEQDPDADAYQKLNVGEVRAPASLNAFERAQGEITVDMTAEQVRAVYLKHGV